jgi:hypothetical protein
MSEKRVTAEQKKAVAKRANQCCEYCRSQLRFAMQPFSIEHIIPKSQGGETNLDNLALSCQGCNNHKYNKTEGVEKISGDVVSLYHPRQHQWKTHFAWNDDFSLVIGLTPIGRVTVETLRLNRTGVVNLRRVLYSIGEHPPSDVLKAG